MGTKKSCVIQMFNEEHVIIKLVCFFFLVKTYSLQDYPHEAVMGKPQIQGDVTSVQQGEGKK